MTNRALLLVDLQNDFCAGGALAVAEGDSTIDIANALIDWCQPRQIPVLASQTGIPRSMAASPASIRRNPIVRKAGRAAANALAGSLRSTYRRRGVTSPA